MSRHYPVLKADQAWPSKSKCPQCHHEKIFEPNQFVVLSGGALKMLDKDNGGPSPDMQGFLDITFHGADVACGGKGKDDCLNDQHATLPLVENSTDGQFELYFCSIECLRSFFEDCVDALEAKLVKKCSDCSKRFSKDDETIQTFSHYEPYLLLCRPCYQKRGNSVR